MFERISDRWKKDASGALRLGAIAAASIVTATVTLSFLCAAAFVIALQRYGLVDACLAGAGVFLLATMALLGTYAIYVARRRRDAQARAALEPPALSALADPRVILAALQIVQAIGFKRLLPIAAIAGAAFALASRPALDGKTPRAKARRRDRRRHSEAMGAAKEESVPEDRSVPGRADAEPKDHRLLSRTFKCDVEACFD